MIEMTSPLGAFTCSNGSSLNLCSQLCRNPVFCNGHAFHFYRGQALYYIFYIFFYNNEYKSVFTCQSPAQMRRYTLLQAPWLFTRAQQKIMLSLLFLKVIQYLNRYPISIWLYHTMITTLFLLLKINFKSLWNTFSVPDQWLST